MNQSLQKGNDRDYKISIRNLWIAMLGLAVTTIASLSSNCFQYLALKSQNDNFRETISEQREQFIHSQKQQNMKFSENLSMQLEQLEQQKEILITTLQHAEKERKTEWLHLRRIELKSRLYKTRLKYSEFFKIFNFFLSELQNSSTNQHEKNDYVQLKELRDRLSKEWSQLIIDTSYIDRLSMEKCTDMIDSYNYVESYAYAAEIYLKELNTVKNGSKRSKIIQMMKSHIHIKNGG